MYIRAMSLSKILIGSEADFELGIEALDALGVGADELMVAGALR